MSLRYFHFAGVLQANGMSAAYVGVDGDGVIRYLSNDLPEEAVAVEYVSGYALPGFRNAHSHAFQYAMAGLAEQHAVGTHDDFWSWREAMYQCALTVDPDQAEAIAAMLYAEMLRHGYTHVAEFHYLHHDKDGRPYANVAEMGERMVAAAKTAGIKITLVPVFYQKGGFGLAPQERQRRFISKSVSDYWKLFEASKGAIKNYDGARLGVSVHSLRAVDLDDIIETVKAAPYELPFHVHVAEQKKEIADCLAYCGKRPMQWLLENVSVDKRFHLVHSTHLDDYELKGLTASGASVVLCPSTEGNLGDGIFRMKEYAQLGGRWSIGTDSHIGLNPLEELRMIDYRQRLVTNMRNTFDGDGARYLIECAARNGNGAMGIEGPGYFETGVALDAVVYDSHSPLVAATSDRNILSTLVYAGDAAMTLGTLVDGRWCVKNLLHKDMVEIRGKFVRGMRGVNR